ncbi:hypothetical protein [Streptomyces spongiae]|uniref:Uncharacterized protein n=1 Tax=Streptomyces spongiae TaxID=565072 RepID=A0A5N8X8W1_9ACTN|nr:hypothetical protein [Streptomyces spongiae]MPY55873.1 hypothetical protein [Streptomyces spongiae]
MKVSSPIGELPFEPTKLRYTRAGIELEGVMGAWPARVQISRKDIPRLIRVALGAAALRSAIVTVFGRRRTAHGRSS